ncbi:hypothetical protein [Geobacillus thermodenitrificans]|uniref:hypothetical protein n=1 Tax=Geobacillus thermodenitrificans TaxID=33940 RepID=UPI002E22626B|nr:hypothetical protein [Geobacillus thermodenitrificans]
MDKDKFTRYLKTIRHYHKDKKVKSIDLKFAAEGLIRGEIRVTDLQLQEDSQITGYVPNTREFFNLKRFSIDESHNAVSGYQNVYLKQEPRKFENVRNRFFNFANRGHAVMVIPNVYHEDYRVDLLPTGVDITIFPKDDYDFLRISTNYGAFIEGDGSTYDIEELASHPLNRRYTREFCFGAGKAGDKIELLSSKHIARVNGKAVPLGVQSFPVGFSWIGDDKYTFKNRQRFMLLPWGSTRIRIEFYKLSPITVGESGQVLEIMKDMGIGYYGFVEFSQWVTGVKF